MDKDNRNYTAYYDTETFSSLWVAYPLAKGHTGNEERTDKWIYAPDIDESQQINVEASYKDSHYDRGHQIPNADRNGIESMRLQTYYFINSTPQISGFNRGRWAQLESAVRNAVPEGDSLYIVTGPVYRTVGGSETIKTTLNQEATPAYAPVPNYYFKVIMKVKRTDGEVTDAQTVGYWFDMEAYENKDTNGGIYEWALSVDEIERRTGFDFFANLPNGIENSAETNTSWTSFLNF